MKVYAPGVAVTAKTLFDSTGVANWGITVNVSVIGALLPAAFVWMAVMVLVPLVFISTRLPYTDAIAGAELV